ncbi:hypothetical protein [Paraburkholderia kururiensis]|uniref:Lipoprotein n=1 Tax=Paraburkholderia kururiensis TaxID=984307 RepID=A0ABZ0WJ74_9BURK|nr:hypothetical protein [Paraburkholderia kururiensis]WQD77376.1 hypothetical protein U0042_25520 [Paraburkholderia kururiensis]
MKIRTLCVAGLATAVTLTAGCVALYTNPGQCEAVMRERLAETSLGAMSVTHTSVAYRGSRVVVEGELPRPASASVAASAPMVASGAESGAESAEESDESDAGASAARAAAGRVSAASDVTRASSATGAASAPEAASAPTSGLKAWFASFKHKPGKPIAAECTFNESGLASFRWLAPPELAKTTADED